MSYQLLIVEIELCSRARKRRVVSQFEDLQACYLNLRRAESTAASELRAEHAQQQQLTANGTGALCGADALGPASGRAPADGGGRSGLAAAANGAAAAANGPAQPAGMELARKGDQSLGPVLDTGGLAEFSRMLSVFTHCSKLKVC